MHCQYALYLVVYLCWAHFIQSYTHVDAIGIEVCNAIAAMCVRDTVQFTM